MKGKSPDSSQTSFLMNGLCEQLNPRHSIYQLSKIIDWESLENDFTRLYSRRGRPAKPVRLMISLLLLKQLHDLSDDQVVEGWIENPYWQLLSGEHELQWSATVASSDLTNFRKRIGKKGAESLLKLSVDLFHPKIKEEEVVVDTTVQEKNITFPTGQEGHRHLQEDRQQGRYFFKAKLHPYRSRPASSGIQPKISQAKEKSRKSNTKNPDNRTRYAS